MPKLLQMTLVADSLGLELDVYKRLVWMGCPVILYEILKFVNTYITEPLRPLHLVEFSYT